MTHQLPVSVVVTTYGIDTRYTQRCLEKIARWKCRHHELIVVVHDASPTLNLYLEYLAMSGVIDRLVRAPSGHGHVAGVNLGFSLARHEFLFNINTDVRVGRGLVDTCAERLFHAPNVGLVGWHYNWGGGHDATRWRNDGLEFTLRTRESNVARKGYLDKVHALNVQRAPWNTGRVLTAAGDRRILCANTSFFGIRRSVWNRIGGFDVRRYPHYFSDDFLCYGVLELGLDIENLPPDVRCSQQPERFESRSDYKYDGIVDAEKFLDALAPHPGRPPYRRALDVVQCMSELGARVALADPGSARGRQLADSGRLISLFPPQRVPGQDPRARWIVVA